MNKPVSVESYFCRHCHRKAHYRRACMHHHREKSLSSQLRTARELRAQFETLLQDVFDGQGDARQTPIADQDLQLLAPALVLDGRNLHLDTDDVADDLPVRLTSPEWLQRMGIPAWPGLHQRSNGQGHDLPTLFNMACVGLPEELRVRLLQLRVDMSHLMRLCGPYISRRLHLLHLWLGLAVSASHAHALIGQAYQLLPQKLEPLLSIDGMQCLLIHGTRIAFHTNTNPMTFPPTPCQALSWMQAGMDPTSAAITRDAKVIADDLLQATLLRARAWVEVNIYAQANPNSVNFRYAATLWDQGICIEDIATALRPANPFSPAGVLDAIARYQSSLVTPAMLEIAAARTKLNPQYLSATETKRAKLLGAELAKEAGMARPFSARVLKYLQQPFPATQRRPRKATKDWEPPVWQTCDGWF